MSTADMLISVGGVAQVLGVGLLYRDVKAILVYGRRKEGQYFQIHTAGEIDPAGQLGLQGGRQPSLHDRVEALEKRVTAFEAQAQSTRRQMESEWKMAIEERAQLIERAVEAKLGRLTTVVVGAGASNARRLMASIILITFGVALSTIGGLLA